MAQPTSRRQTDAIRAARRDAHWAPLMLVHEAHCRVASRPGKKRPSARSAQTGIPGDSRCTEGRGAAGLKLRCVVALPAPQRGIFCACRSRRLRTLRACDAAGGTCACKTGHGWLFGCKNVKIAFITYCFYTRFKELIKIKNTFASWFSRARRRAQRRNGTNTPTHLAFWPYGSGNINVPAAPQSAPRTTRRNLTYTRPVYVSRPRRSRGITQASLFRVI